MRIKMNDYERRWDNSTRRWIYKHREMMENHLGRKLLFTEHIHHKNGNVLDNRLENLELTDLPHHMVIHSPVYKRINRPVLGCKSLAPSNASHPLGNERASGKEDKLDA